MKNDKLIGVERIEIELAGTTLNVKRYTQRYKDIVNDAVRMIEKDGLPIDELTFFERVWLIFGYRMCWLPNEFLWFTMHNEYLQLDCNTAAFLIYDIGNQLGIRTNIVLVPEHVLIKTDSYYFETTDGTHYPISKINEHWPIRHYEGHDAEKIHAISYNVRGCEFNLLSTHMRKGLSAQIKSLLGTDCAIEALNTAIGKIPVYALAYHNRAKRKMELLRADDAIKDYDLALKHYPNCWKAYDGRARAQYSKLVYGQGGSPEKIRDDFSHALKIIDNLLQIRRDANEQEELLGSRKEILGYLQDDPRLN